MTERLFAFLLVGALVAPQIGFANESGFNNDRERQTALSLPEKLPLPTIHYLDTMTWMKFGWESKGPRIDTLLLPDLNIPAVPRNSMVANNNSSHAEQPMGKTYAE